MHAKIGGRSEEARDPPFLHFLDFEFCYDCLKGDVALCHDPTLHLDSI